MKKESLQKIDGKDVKNLPEIEDTLSFSKTKTYIRRGDGDCVSRAHNHKMWLFPQVFARLGTKRRACEKLEIPYPTVMYWFRNNENFREECHKAQQVYKEEWKDRFESVIDEKIFDEKDTVIISKMMSSDRLKDREFGNRQEIDMNLTKSHEEMLKEIE